MLMCLRHWRMVPRKLQINVWNEYRAGQEIDKRPTLEYLLVQQAAVACVAAKEGLADEAAEARANVLKFQTLMKARGEDLKKR